MVIRAGVILKTFSVTCLVQDCEELNHQVMRWLGPLFYPFVVSPHSFSSLVASRQPDFLRSKKQERSTQFKGVLSQGCLCTCTALRGSAFLHFEPWHLSCLTLVPAMLICHTASLPHSILQRTYQPIQREGAGSQRREQCLHAVQ